MAIFGLIKRLVSPVTDIISEVVTDKDKANELEHKIEMALSESIDKELEAKRDIIVAEAKSDNWLASSWRPILMLSFTAIVVNNYILAPYLGAMFSFEVILEIPADMWDLLKIGVGGYIVGRSGEKITEKYTKGGS